MAFYGAGSIHGAGAIYGAQAVYVTLAVYGEEILNPVSPLEPDFG